MVMTIRKAEELIEKEIMDTPKFYSLDEDLVSVECEPTDDCINIRITYIMLSGELHEIVYALEPDSSINISSIAKAFIRDCQQPKKGCFCRYCG